MNVGARWPKAVGPNTPGCNRLFAGKTQFPTFSFVLNVLGFVYLVTD